MIVIRRSVFLLGAIIFGAFGCALLSISILISSRRAAAEQMLGQQTHKSIAQKAQPTLLETPTPVQPSTISLPPIPTAKTLPGGIQVFQTFNNCGPASLSMALSHFGIEETQKTLGEQIRPYQNQQGDNDDKSVTLDEIAKKAQEYNLLTYHRPAGDVEMMKRFIALDLPVITRTWLHKGEDIGHYRVVKGYDETTGVFIQDDSMQGANKQYTYAEYQELWQAFNYEYLVLVPPEKKELVERILGDSLDEKNAWTKALNLSERQLAIVPTDVFAQFNKSVALYHLEKYEQSIVVFEQVQSRLPRRMLWYQIEPILAYYKLGKDDKVMELTNQILNDKNRAFSELYYLQEQLYTKRGDRAAAQEASENMLKYNSESYWKVNVEM